MKFRKKPVVIEAVQLLWTTWAEMCVHAGVGKLVDGKPEGRFLTLDGNASSVPVEIGHGSDDHGSGAHIGLCIPTLEGLMLAQEGDWVIRGVKGELYPCKPDIFAATYEPVEEQ
jgi:hypothetical protein